MSMIETIKKWFSNTDSSDNDIPVEDNTLHHYQDDIEFIDVVLDASDNILYGVQNDGNFYFGSGVPKQIKNKILENNSTLQKQIDNIINNHSDIQISVSPEIVFTSAVCDMKITSKVTTGYTIEGNDHKVKRGSTTLFSSNDTNIVCYDKIRTNKDITYTSEVNINGSVISKSVTVTVVGRIYYGSGKNTLDAKQSVPIPKISPAGKYTITINNDDDHIIFDIPDGMEIKSASINGFNVPLVDIDSSRLNHHGYKTVNTYDSGVVLNIDIL